MTAKLLDGWNEIEKALNELLDLEGEGKETANALRRAGRKAMQPVLEAAIDKAPEDSGNLKSNIKMTAKVGKTKKQQSAVTVQVGTNRKAKYALHQEYGTSEIEAQPFLRPALAENSDKVLTGLESELKTELDKSVKKIQRKMKKGGSS